MMNWKNLVLIIHFLWLIWFLVATDTHFVPSPNFLSLRVDFKNQGEALEEWDDRSSGLSIPPPAPCPTALCFWSLLSPLFYLGCDYAAYGDGAEFTFVTHFLEPASHKALHRSLACLLLPGKLVLCILRNMRLVHNDIYASQRRDRDPRHSGWRTRNLSEAEGTEAKGMFVIHMVIRLLLLLHVSSWASKTSLDARDIQWIASKQINMI